MFLSCTEIGLGTGDIVSITLHNNSDITLWWKTQNQGGVVQPYKSEIIVLWYNDVLSYYESGSLITKEVIISHELSRDLNFIYDKTSNSFVIK